MNTLGMRSQLTLERASVSARLTLASHRLLDLPSGDVAMLADRSTGWAILPGPAYRAIAHFTTTGVRSLAGADQQSCEIFDKLWDAGLLLADGKGNPATTTSPPQWPDALLLKLTGSCNIECTYCYDYDTSRFRARLGLERICDTLSDLAQHVPRLSIVFHGGEPLLCFDLMCGVVAYAERLRDSGLEVAFSIQTNATLFTDDSIRFLEEHDFSVGISLDGADDAANALRVVRRGPGVLERVRELMREHPSFVRERCGFLAVASRTSTPHLPDLARWLQDFGVGGLSVTFLDLVGRGTQLASERLEPQEAVDVIAGFVSMVRAGDLHELDLKTITSRVNNLFTFTGRDLCHKGPCGASGEFLVLDAEGRYRSCDCIYDPFFELGADKLPDAGHRQRLAVVARTDALRESGDSCASCPLFGLCGGTCVAKALARSGTPISVDPVECALSKYIYPELLREFASGAPMPLFDYYNSHRSARGRVWTEV
jgi:uncharacterized protein